MTKVLRCLKNEFYSDPKQTPSSLLFITGMSLTVETLRDYAEALVLFVYYAYKGNSQFQLNKCCQEQFFSSLRCTTTEGIEIQDLVRKAEAFAATRNEKMIISDGEGPSPVTVRYVQGKPSKNKSQTQKSTVVEANQGMAFEGGGKTHKPNPPEKVFRGTPGSKAFYHLSQDDVFW